MKMDSATQQKAGMAGLMLSILLGGWVRLSAPYMAGFPINDGGLFQVMLLALKNNNFNLPNYVEFSGLTIPFTYPPLGFYIGGFLVNTFQLDPIKILQWLPASVLIFTIPAFFWLANSILESALTAGVATFVYAFTPIATQWALMGGGLTRSFGLLFLLLTLGSVHQLFRLQQKKYLPAAILFGALTVLSHPEATINAVAFCFLLWIFYGRNKTGSMHAAIVGIGILAVTSLWWLPIVARFGLSPYLVASQSNPHFIIALLFPFFFLSTQEPQITVIAVLGLIGFVYALAQKKYLLPVFLLLPYLVQLRSASVYSAISLAMLAGLAIAEIILPAISNPSLKNKNIYWVVLIYLAMYLPMNAMSFSGQLAGTAISSGDREAFEWIKANTPANSKFLILTGEKNEYCDGISEWFPALTERINPFIVQGTEWLPGKLTTAIQADTDLQACLSGNDAFDCVKTATQSRGIDYNYIYIARQASIKPACLVTSKLIRGDNLMATLGALPEYSLIYKTDDAVIFARQQK